MEIELRKIGGECVSGDCAAVYITDEGGIIVQGTLVSGVDQVTPAPGEALVEIPRSVLLEAASAVGR
jgi:hypothetical protein